MNAKYKIARRVCYSLGYSSYELSGKCFLPFCLKELLCSFTSSEGAYKESIYYGTFKTPLTWIDSPSGMVIVHSLELSQLPKWTQTSLL